MKGWWAVVKTRKVLAGVSLAVVFLVYHFMIFGETEGIAEIRPLVSPGSAVLTIGLGILLWELFWAPFKLEQERERAYKEEMTGLCERLTRLEEEKSEIARKLFDENRLIEGASILADLLDEAQKIRDDTKHDPMEERQKWYEKVCAILREYYPLAEASFRSVHSTVWQTGHRDILREEMSKLSVILVSIRESAKR